MLKGFEVPSGKDCVFNASFGCSYKLNIMFVLLFDSSVVLSAFPVNLHVL